jgi:septum formation protein
VRIVLASASPRRRELLAALVADFDVIPSDIPEEMHGDPMAEAMRLAAAKARAVASLAPGALVIGSDTVVHDGARFFDKPRDAVDATAMLRDLRGRPHSVITGVSVVCGGTATTGASEARVTLRDLSDGDIAAYVASGRPLDKAGAYAIQDEDVPTVAGLDGCYCCVVGLPLWRLRAGLLACGVEAREPYHTFARCAACPERPSPFA